MHDTKEPRQDLPALSLEGISVRSLDEAEDVMDRMVLRHAPDNLPAYRRLRERYGAFAPGFAYTVGGDVTIARNFALPEAPTLMALGYEAVKKCLFDQKHFDGKLYDGFNSTAEGEPEFQGLPLMEGRPHLRLRRLLGQGLNPRSIRVWEDRMVRPVVRRLLDALEWGAPVDLARRFCRPLPGAAIGAVLGLREEDLEAFNLMAFLMFTAPVNDEGKKAEQRIGAYFAAHVAHRMSLDEADLAGRDDIITLMVKARDGDDRLSPEEIIPNLFFFLFAGSDTTYLTLCNIVHYLVEEPGLFDRVKEKRDRIPDLIEETLRLNPPGPVIGRRAKADTEVLGCPIAQGTPVTINLLMANRDAETWERPDVFDLDRAAAKGHLSFGFGPHICPGMHLARLEMTVALNELFDRTSRIEWDPDAGRPEVTGVGSRAIAHTRVVLHA
jgi:cytochrome P450